MLFSILGPLKLLKPEKQSLKIYLGHSVIFTVYTALFTVSVSTNWTLNGMPLKDGVKDVSIAGQQELHYTVNGVEEGDGGIYNVRVTPHNQGIGVSRSFTLEVIRMLPSMPLQSLLFIIIHVTLGSPNAPSITCTKKFSSELLVEWKSNSMDAFERDGVKEFYVTYQRTESEVLQSINKSANEFSASITDLEACTLYLLGIQAIGSVLRSQPDTTSCRTKLSPLG